MLFVIAYLLIGVIYARVTLVKRYKFANEFTEEKNKAIRAHNKQYNYLIITQEKDAKVFKRASNVLAILLWPLSVYLSILGLLIKPFVYWFNLPVIKSEREIKQLNEQLVDYRNQYNNAELDWEKEALKATIDSLNQQIKDKKL